MRKSIPLSFVFICLVIISLTSCGNLLSTKTGSVAIALPGKPAGRISNLTPDDIAGASYTITLTQPSGKTITRNAKGGTEVVINDLQPGSYLVNVIASARFGFFTGSSKGGVDVKANEIAYAEINLELVSLFTYWAGISGMDFTIARQIDDSDYQDCFLIGSNGICIKPNLDRSDISTLLWSGTWPFRTESNITFYLGGTFNGNWHDQTVNPVSLQVNSAVCTGTYELPNNNDIGAYKGNHPTVDGFGVMKWQSGNFDIPGEMWCKIEIWGGTSTAEESGSYISGTHFKCSGSEYQALTSEDGVRFEQLSLYENKSSEALKAELRSWGNWFIRCSLFFKPEGDASTYQIELPLVQSTATNIS